MHKYNVIKIYFDNNAVDLSKKCSDLVFTIISSNRPVKISENIVGSLFNQNNLMSI